jgi:multimeric flavodoxin WrbA
LDLKTLGISTSPRLKGNSDLLLRETLSGAESAGSHVEYLRLCDFHIRPCVECNTCYETGMCRIKDDYQEVIEKILNADRLIFATPIFFMTVCAQAKMLIDRGQCLWAYKYRLKKELLPGKYDRRAMVIAVGGSKSIKQFESVQLTMKAYFDVIQMNYMSNMFVNKIDTFGAIKKHPSAMTEAFRLGVDLVMITDQPAKPINVELI